MTVVVEPSEQRSIANSETLSAIARWAADDWIVPSSSDLNASRLGLSGAPLNAAAISTSGLDVTISTFEAYIGGSYLGSDDDTISEHTHTLAGNSTTTTLFLGYDIANSDTFRFGPASEFNAADPRIPVGDFVDDGSSVTDIFDRRPIGQQPHTGEVVAATFDTDDTTSLTIDTGTISDPYPAYDVVIYREDHGSSGEDYQEMRVNGDASGNYYQDLYDAPNNSHTSVDGVDSWRRIAGTNLTYGAVVHQTVRVQLPPELVATGQHHPLFSMIDVGAVKNASYAQEGHLEVDSTDINRIEVFGGRNSTGHITIYGLGTRRGGGAPY